MVKKYIDLEKNIFTDPVSGDTSAISTCPIAGKFTFLTIYKFYNDYPFRLLEISAVNYIEKLGITDYHMGAFPPVPSEDFEKVINQLNYDLNVKYNPGFEIQTSVIQDLPW